LEVIEANPTSEIAKLSDSQLAAPESHRSQIDATTSLVETGNDMSGQAASATEISPDLREVVTAWLDLNPAIKNAILSIVRNSPPLTPGESCDSISPPSVATQVGELNCPRNNPSIRLG
jgi:hypothetical protein